jgi:hypothetical protein
MTESNIQPFAPRSFVDDLELSGQAEKQSESIGEFEAAGMLFRVKALSHRNIKEDCEGQEADGEWRDADHARAIHEGYDTLCAFGAVGPDGKVYAIWQIYTHSGEPMAFSKSRAIQTDKDWQDMGIGSGLAQVIRAEYSVAWSGLYTPAGAKLKDRLDPTGA